MENKTIICIQPKERKDLTLPYPYFIDMRGKVGRQDFWKGKPLRIIGFNPKPKSGYMPKSITSLEFLLKPKLAIGMYPIFEHKDGQWFTYKDPIASVKVIKK